MNHATRASGDIFVIRKREDFDLICSPIRASILEYLVAFGPMPVREIARRIGRSATLTHHHAGILHRGGLIRETDPVKRGKHLERVFSIGPVVWKYDFEHDPEAMAEGMLRIARTWGRHNERLLAKVLGADRQDHERFQHFASIRAETGRLSEKSAAAVREHLQAIRRIFERDRKLNAGEYFQVFWSYFPLGSSTAEKSLDRPGGKARNGTPAAKKKKKISRKK